MESWRAKAIEILPEMEEDTNPSDNPMALWIEIRMEFDHAYKEPRNEDLIRRIYGYAGWCLEQGERTDHAETDLPTCVVVCFYEHIPTREASRQDMPRWFSRADIVLMKEIFSYHLNLDEYGRLLAMFPEPQPSRMSKKARGRQKSN